MDARSNLNSNKLVFVLGERKSEREGKRASSKYHILPSIDAIEANLLASDELRIFQLNFLSGIVPWLGNIPATINQNLKEK